MYFSNRPDHAMIAVYGDDKQASISKAVTLYQSNRETRILTPDTIETLESSAQNSALTLIGIHDMEDKALALGRVLQKNKRIAGGLIAVYLGEEYVSYMDIMASGFDGCIGRDDLNNPNLKAYISHRLDRGTQRIEGLLQGEEYVRLNDALSITPISMIIFDSDKKAVFVSDHYFRAYPRIAPRLIRGLRVYDAFEMMVKEEGLKPDDERYERIQKFWHTLNDSVEFTLDNGSSYRLKAIPLPAGRGTVVIGQNMTSIRRAYEKKP